MIRINYDRFFFCHEIIRNDSLILRNLTFLYQLSTLKMYYNTLHQYPYLFIEGIHKSENFYWENVISMTFDGCKF